MLPEADLAVNAVTVLEVRCLTSWISQPSPSGSLNTTKLEKFSRPIGGSSSAQCGVTPSAEPIGSARPAPRRDPRNTVSRARPFRCGTP